MTVIESSSARPRPSLRRALLVGAAAVLLAMGAGCDQVVGDPPDGGESAVLVVRDGSEVVVELGTLEAVDLGEGELHVRLSDVLEAASLGIVLASVELDFVAGDGFTPRDSPNCTDELVPVAGSLATRGYLHRLTRRLEWDVELGFPGCLRVQDTARVLVLEATDP